MAKGDAEFTSYVAEHRRRLVRAAFLLCGNWAQAEDVTQISLAKLYVAWPRIRRSRGPDAYVRKIITRTVVDESRRPWRRELLTDNRFDETTDTVVSDRPVDLDLASALRSLPVSATPNRGPSFAGEPVTSTDPATDLARGRAPRRHTLTFVAGAAVVAVVALAAVSTQPNDRLEAIPAGPPKSTTLPAGPAPGRVASDRTFLLPPDTDQRIYYSGIRSDPLPTPPPRTTVSATAAKATARKGGPPGSPIAVLRLISAPGHVSSIPSTPQPYWVLVWPHTPPGIAIGRVMPDRKAQEAADKKRAEEAATSVCADVTFVDANTGRLANSLWHLCTHR